MYIFTRKETHIYIYKTKAATVAPMITGETTKVVAIEVASVLQKKYKILKLN
jgi:hypothetical protein